MALVASTSEPQEPEGQLEDSGWTDATPTMFAFDTIGDMFTGEYVGKESIVFINKKGEEDSFYQYTFRKDGELFATNGSASLNAGMKNVPEGALTRLTYTEDKDTGQPSAMKVIRVQYKA